MEDPKYYRRLVNNNEVQEAKNAINKAKNNIEKKKELNKHIAEQKAKMPWKEFTNKLLEGIGKPLLNAKNNGNVPGILNVRKTILNSITNVGIGQPVDREVAKKILNSLPNRVAALVKKHRNIRKEQNAYYEKMRERNVYNTNTNTNSISGNINMSQNEINANRARRTKAATKIQAGMRGMRNRQRVARMREEIASNLKAKVNRNKQLRAEMNRKQKEQARELAEMKLKAKPKTNSGLVGAKIVKPGGTANVNPKAKMEEERRRVREIEKNIANLDEKKKQMRREKEERAIKTQEILAGGEKRRAEESRIAKEKANKEQKKRTRRFQEMMKPSASPPQRASVLVGSFKPGNSFEPSESQVNTLINNILVGSKRNAALRNLRLYVNTKKNNSPEYKKAKQTLNDYDALSRVKNGNYLPVLTNITTGKNANNARSKFVTKLYLNMYGSKIKTNLFGNKVANGVRLNAKITELRNKNKQTQIREIPAIRSAVNRTFGKKPADKKGYEYLSNRLRAIERSSVRPI